MSRRPSGRHRGGQPGNHNRLKHGLYARQLPIRHELRLERLGFNRNEMTIALARVRLKQLLEKQETSDACDFLAYERAIQYYLDLITRLIQRNSDLRRQTAINSRDVAEVIAMLEDL
jgi:hypothetical protein